MLKQSSNLFLALFAVILFTACGGPSGEEVATGEAIADNGGTITTAAAYAVDVAASTLSWEGTKLVGGGHNGTIGLKEGNIAVSGGNIVGGMFTLDMASLKNTDLPAEKQPNLEGHLKSGDFFDVEAFPTATFEVKNVVPASGRDDISHMVTGNLTMKDSTRSVTIPLMVDMTSDQLTAKSPQFVINRTEWGIHYGSGLSGAAQDEIINDNIGLQINLVAKK